MRNDSSSVETSFTDRSGFGCGCTKIPYIVVEHFPQLGLLTALRFLEWVSEHPEGVIALPTGKTPEYFIKWMQHLLFSWDQPEQRKLRGSYDLDLKTKPDLRGLQFVQIDEFYPIDSSQNNSFYHYVKTYYLDAFGLDPKKALLIDCNRIPLSGGRFFRDVFPDLRVDLTLRHREPVNHTERIQQESILLVDEWCADYEQKIRDRGGIGFFLGGIGPDGHIAFNIRGSDHHSTTRLMSTNFETQAVSAADLGGITVSRNRLVITIGLRTITAHPETVAIIFAAGEAKAGIVKQALESEPTNRVPATVLQKLKHGRFYLTRGAASKLEERVEMYYNRGSWSGEKTARSIIDFCKANNIYGPKLTVKQLRTGRETGRIPDLGDSTLPSLIKATEEKINKGLKRLTDEVFLHTGPHHDDILLGMLPYIAHHIREASNRFKFVNFTSGFTAVSNAFLLDVLKRTRSFLDEGRIEMVRYKDFFQSGYQFKRAKDVYHYLNQTAANDKKGMRRGFCHRLVRNLVDIYEIASLKSLNRRIDMLIKTIETTYDGAKDAPDIQQLKGRIREFEEELSWANFGVRMENIHHLRLGFYTGDIFTEIPEKKRDVEPFLHLLREIQPSIISLALDPEGSGPDTHYKVLQIIAEALRIRKEEVDFSDIKIWGYRNVWYRFHPAEADIIVPVSLNSMAMLKETFLKCYPSQADASFPSYEHDGPFNALIQRIWVEQLKDIQLLMGKEFFYLNDHPRIRASHGLLYLKEMSVEHFLDRARKLEESMEGVLNG